MCFAFSLWALRVCYYPKTETLTPCFSISATVHTVIIFLTLSDRALTLPGNILCMRVRSTWPAGQENIRGTSKKLQREHKNENKAKMIKKRETKQKGKYALKDTVDSMQRLQY